VNDNGKGLRALFYGLCSLWEIDVWDEDAIGETPADFYLLSGTGCFVVIAPEPQDRQVEIAALQARQERFIILDAEDLNRLRVEHGPRSAGVLFEEWFQHGTRAYAKRRAAGIMT
jgi:hypothetical protein